MKGIQLPALAQHELLVVGTSMLLVTWEIHNGFVSSAFMKDLVKTCELYIKFVEREGFLFLYFLLSKDHQNNQIMSCVI